MGLPFFVARTSKALRLNCLSATISVDGTGGEIVEKIFAEIVTRSEVRSGMLEIAVSDAAGQSHTVCLNSSATATLIEILGELSKLHAQTPDCLTKTPEHYAVGRGRYEPFVLLRFEDEPAYGLTAEQATNLGEALLEEAEAVLATRYPMRQ